MLCFSWHEIGMVDIPTKIDYILQQTGQKKIHYAGHSQGSTAFLVMTSERPEYNNKIKSMYSLGPVAFSSHMFSPVFQVLARFMTPVNVS